MLFNLSNHPSANWPSMQLQAALEQYGKIQDIDFPHIDPHWAADEVLQLAENYYSSIKKSVPYSAAVHIMGELTFTFALVQKLKAAGIPCIASTTERKIINEENGNKTSAFTFVRFRQY